MKIISVVGARPNFIKISPVHKAFLGYTNRVEHKICHTGQHFDEKMSKVFFEELEMPKPDFYLGIGSGTHASQTAGIMLAFEKVIEEEKPDLVIVPGDVNSTMACSLVASKMGIKIAHIEAGLRSFDNRMPEEINRKITDVLSDYLFVTEKSGINNLEKEGVSKEKIHFVGNVMIDSLRHYMPKIQNSGVLRELSLQPRSYLLATFHRPSNVDDFESLRKLVLFLNNLSENQKVIFPVHPRTRMNLKKAGLEKSVSQHVILLEPLGYIDFIALVREAFLVVTDSGGIQEETTWMGVPCVTVRENTERPVTVEIGTNILAGTNLGKVETICREIFSGVMKQGRIPELWDGNSAKRIVEIILRNESV